MSPPPDKPSPSTAPGPASTPTAAHDAPPSASFDPFSSTASLGLLVRLPDGERHQVDLPPNASIKDLKSAIAGMVDDGPSTSHAPWDLDFGGSILDDKHTLQHYNIPDAYDHANGLLKTISDSGYVDPDKKVEALDKAVAVVHGISRGEHDMEKLISGAFDDAAVAADANEPNSPSAQPSLRAIRRSRRSRIPSLNFSNLPPPFPLPGPKSAKPSMPSAPPTPSQLLRRLSCSRPDLYDPSAVPDDDDAAIPPVSPRMTNKAVPICKDASAPISSITVSAPESTNSQPPPTVTVSTAASPTPGDTQSRKHPPPPVAAPPVPHTHPEPQPSKQPQQPPQTQEKPQQQAPPPKLENASTQSIPPPPTTTQQETQQQLHQPPANRPPGTAAAAQNGAQNGDDLERGNTTWFNDVISSFGKATDKQNQSDSDGDNDVDGDSEDDDANAPSTTAPSREASQPRPASPPHAGVKAEVALPAAASAANPGTTVAPARLSANVALAAAQNGPAGTKSEPAPVAREGSPNGTVRSGATSTMSVSSAPGGTGGGTAAGAVGATSSPSRGGGQVIGLTPDTGNTVVGADGKVRKKRGRKRKNPHLSEEERKAQRQAQNRESAKLSRIRRKNMTIEYEKRVTTLEGENENLRDTVAALTDRLEMLQNLLTISVQKRAAVPPGAIPNLAAAAQQHVDSAFGAVGAAQPAGPIAAARQLNAAQLAQPVGMPAAMGAPLPLGSGGMLTAQQGQGAFAAPMANGRGGAAALGSGAMPNVNMNFKN